MPSRNFDNTIAYSSSDDDDLGKFFEELAKSGPISVDDSAAELLEALDAHKSDRSNKVTDASEEWSNEVTKPSENTGRIKSPSPSQDRCRIKSRRRARRSDKKDQETLQRLRKFKLPSDGAAAPSFSSDLSPPISPLSGDTTPLPVWELTSDRMKLVSATVALQAWGEAVSFTFNIPTEAEAAFLAHPKGFIRSISLAFNRAAKRRLGSVPLYWLSADITKQERLHLHGAIAYGAGDLDRLKEVMIEAWGAWEGRGKERQVDFNSQRCDDGWVDYAIWARAKVRAVIGDHTFIISKELRRRARFIHGEMRATVRENA